MSYFLIIMKIFNHYTGMQRLVTMRLAFQLCSTQERECIYSLLMIVQ